MQIKVTGKGLQITPALRDYIHDKITKLEEFFRGIQKAEVIVESRANANADKRQVAEIRAWLSGKKTIQAVEGARDAYAAFDLALQEAKRQVEKHKEKHVKEIRRKGFRLKLLSRLKIPGLSRQTPETEQ